MLAIVGWVSKSKVQPSDINHTIQLVQALGGDEEALQIITYYATMYGNLRGSDLELLIYSFEEGTYGERIEQKYPFYNWLVVFQGFVSQPVTNSDEKILS